MISKNKLHVKTVATNWKVEQKIKGNKIENTHGSSKSNYMHASQALTTVY